MSELWTQWEGQIVDDQFPLRRCVGSSDHSGVFLSEIEQAGSSQPVALKLVPAIPTLAEWQLAHWNAAMGLSHPHVIRLRRAGRCQLGDHHYLYVVMEYSDQNLAQLLANRALTEAEAREMLPAVLDALGFLHERHLVQGQLKPSNILVVGDQLKLASDTILPAGEARASIGQTSAYDPPEARDGTSSTAADVWALGVTLVQALTRADPSARIGRTGEVVLPADFPPAMTGIVRECLSYDPGKRPSVARLHALIRASERAVGTVAETGTPTGPVVADQPNSASDELQAYDRPRASGPAEAWVGGRVSDGTRRDRVAAIDRWRPWAVPAAGIAAVVLVSWAGARIFTHHKTNTAAVTQQSESAQTVASPPPVARAPAEAAQPPQPTVTAAAPSSRAPAAKGPDRKTGATAAVIHEEIPRVPRAARQTIRGHVKVAVRVTVDSSGKVVGQVLAEPGPSRYFARLASDAARKWRFSRSDDRASRQWLVRFVFSRDGTTGHAAEAG